MGHKHIHQKMLLENFICDSFTLSKCSATLGLLVSRMWIHYCWLIDKNHLKINFIAPGDGLFIPCIDYHSTIAGSCKNNSQKKNKKNGNYEANQTNK